MSLHLEAKRCLSTASIQTSSITSILTPKNLPYVFVSKNIPLSADDGQIKRALELRKCEVKRLYREKLRVDGRLTNCETGDRFAIISFIDTPLPTSMEVGRYRAAVYHKGQPNDRLKCGKCLQTGHNDKRLYK